MKATIAMLCIPIAALGASGSIADQSTPIAGLAEVKFGSDSATLSTDVARQLEPAVRFALAHPEQRIVLDAHCDPRGTPAHNVRLAIRRAEAVREQLVASGVAEDQLVFAIYGAAGPRRESYAADRRVTLWPTRQPLAAVIDHTIRNHGTAVTWSQPLSTAQIASAATPVASR